MASSEQPLLYLEIASESLPSWHQYCQNILQRKKKKSKFRNSLMKGNKFCSGVKFKGKTVQEGKVQLLKLLQTPAIRLTCSESR